MGLSRPDAGNFYFVLVAICHQTSPRGSPPLEGTVEGRHLRGWDYLSAKLLGAVRRDPGLLKPMIWTNITAKQIGQIFRDDALGERLTDSDGRALLIRDLGVVMQEHGWSSLDDMHHVCTGRIHFGQPNLLELLTEFRAYQDPVRKKSFLLLALMRNAGLWSYQDNENLGPPVDYHEIRGHLRLGTVRINDRELRDKILTKKAVTAAEDIAVRDAVREAIVTISRDLGRTVSPIVLHYLFWNVFRSCCTHESPHCRQCPESCSLPARYIPLAIRANGSRRCPFADVCESANSTVRLQEHVFDTDYY